MASSATKMKAILTGKYGHPEKVLSLKEIPKPSPKAKEVLIKIHASAVNDYDWSMVRGKPYLYRLLFGLFKPKHSVPGMELAGVAEGIGPNVQKTQNWRSSVWRHLQLWIWNFCRIYQY